VKKPPFIDINPNGRVPAIQDPNTDLTLWETGAINQYLIDEYDKEKRLVYPDKKQRNLLNQMLHFQMSGQGPYYGQCGWFQHLHPTKYPDAIERYVKEIKRVLGVLEIILMSNSTESETPWLVGGKMTYADMAFVPWNFRLSEVLMQTWDEVWEGTPRVRAWHERMIALPSWERSMKLRAELMDDQRLQWNGVPKGIDTFTEYEAKIAAGKDTTAKRA
jgi:glutathione S-transferase